MSRLEVANDAPGAGGDDGTSGDAGKSNNGGKSSGGGDANTGATAGEGAATNAGEGGGVSEGGSGNGGTPGNGGKAGDTSMAGETNPPQGGVPGGGGEGGAAPDPGPPACKAVTTYNGSGLTLKAADISAFKYVSSPASNITKMAYDPTTGLVVMLAQNGNMYGFDATVALPTSASANVITSTAVYDGGGYSPNSGYMDHRGIAFDADGTLYVLATKGGSSSGLNIKKGVKAGAGRTWTTLVTTSVGYNAGGSNFDHSFSNITVSPDGAYLFVNAGARTDHGEVRGSGSLREEPLSSAILRVPTATTTDLKNDGASLAPFLYADGLHNAYDMDFNAQGDLIAAENGPDMDLPDELNWIQSGKHYGFPWRFGAVDNPVIDSSYMPSGDTRLNNGNAAVADGSYKYDASFPAKPQGVTFTDPIINYGPDANHQRVSRTAGITQAGANGMAGITGHRSPLGLAFDTAGALCGDYYKQGFLLSYGALTPAALGEAGQDLLLVRLTKHNGAYSMTAKQLALTIKNPIDSVLVGNRLFTVGYGSGQTVYVFALPTP